MPLFQTFFVLAVITEFSQNTLLTQESEITFLRQAVTGFFVITGLMMVTYIKMLMKPRDL